LRSRVQVIFVFGAFMLSLFLALAAYSFTRSNLVDQRRRDSTAQAYRNAQFVEAELAGGQATTGSISERLTSIGVSRFAVNVGGEWTADAVAQFDPSDIPDALLQRVLDERNSAQMIVEIDSNPVLVTGVPVTDGAASYFEFISLDEVRSTLRSVQLSLMFGGGITTLAGAVLGYFAARRAARPLGEAALAAQAIAGGRLDTRLVPTDDHDLRMLANSFNDMAAALQQRVERDARFASDVSHELRSPLMTLSASVEVMQGRRDEMPERAQAALDLLVGDVTRFQGLVEDLLEISRFDAGAIRLNREELLAAEFVRQAVAVSSAPTTRVTVDPEAELLMIEGDRRRLARVVANLIDNARLHGGGDAEITVSAPPHDGGSRRVWIAVEDHGPGVPDDERSLIFERFARGAVAGRRSSSDGAGLGLALVDEHIRLHGGRIWVDDRSDAEPGARFVIELPAEEV
jgi:signal transduction histidine kinase